MVAHDWAGEHRKAWNAVFAKGRKRGNAGFYGPALVEMEIADADKRADWAYQTCCEIWEIQGRVKRRPLFRAIFGRCLQPMFSVRTGCFRHELELVRTRTRIPLDLSAICGHMNREMDKLAAKWNTILEIATRNCQYREPKFRQKTLAAPVSSPQTVKASLQVRVPDADVVSHSNSEPLPIKQVSAAAASFTWKELESRFRDIQTKLTVNETVSVEYTRTEWDSGSVTVEWRISGTSVFRHDFDRLASIAARKLGYSQREDAAKYWLGQMWEWLQQTGLNNVRSMAWCPTGGGTTDGRTYTTEHFNTERIAEMSAMFCVELMANGAPESAISQEMSRLDQSKPEPKRAGPKTKQPSHRMSVIFGAIQSNLKGPKYCAALDERRLHPPAQWMAEGCPDTYRRAYREPQWRKRIHDEKHRHHKQYKELPASEQEAIIQAEGRTRRTRS